MKLTWLGHACFLLEEDGYRIVLDPYTGVAGYPPLHIQAHAVFCSHGHFDHHATDCVELLPERESPFTVREVETFHDDRGGALRGTNTVRIFTAGGLSVAHLGDLGHQLTVEQAAAMTHTMIPKEVREAAGITDGMIRMSVGLEDPDDIIADLDQALSR